MNHGQRVGDLELETRVRAVLRRHPEISSAAIFGSRAQGTHKPTSDVDLALWGRLDPLGAEALAAELDELPLPYRFDVVAFDHVQLPELRENIRTTGRVMYCADLADLIREIRTLLQADGRAVAKLRAEEGEQNPAARGQPAEPGTRAVHPVGSWTHVCTALDTMGDADLAMTAYRRLGPGPQELGERYLATYGLLQALVIQQDAAEVVVKSLRGDIGPKARSMLDEIRRIRNRIAHPTEPEHRKGKRIYTMIHQGYMRVGDLHVRYHGPDVGNHESGRIDISELIDRQRVVLHETLSKLRDAMRQDSWDREARLSANLMPLLNRGNHALEKLSESIASRDRSWGDTGLGLLSGVLEELGPALADQASSLEVVGDCAKMTEGIRQSLDAGKWELAAWLTSYLGTRLDELAMRPGLGPASSQGTP
jgi:predicted nucleotidyltransferase